MYLDLQAASRHGKGSNRAEEVHNHRVRDRTGAVCELGELWAGAPQQKKLGTIKTVSAQRKCM